MKSILIFGSIGTLLFFLYSMWYSKKNKTEKKNIAIELTNINLKIKYPQETTLLLSDIIKSFWRDNEIDKYKVFVELKSSDENKIFEIDTEIIKLKPHELCKLINESL